MTRWVALTLLLAACASQRATSGARPVLAAPAPPPPAGPQSLAPTPQPAAAPSAAPRSPEPASAADVIALIVPALDVDASTQRYDSNSRAYAGQYLRVRGRRTSAPDGTTTLDVALGPSPGTLAGEALTLSFSGAARAPRVAARWRSFTDFGPRRPPPNTRIEGGKVELSGAISDALPLVGTFDLDLKADGRAVHVTGSFFLGELQPDWAGW